LEEKIDRILALCQAVTDETLALRQRVAILERQRATNGGNVPVIQEPTT
jgi:hypothetical protein